MSVRVSVREPAYAAPGVRHWEFPRSAASVALLVDFGRERGLPVGALLEGTGLRDATIADASATISARQELGVAANLVRLCDRPGFGFEVGSRYRVGVFGIFGYACLTSPTLGDAIRFAFRHFELSFGFCVPTVYVVDATAYLTLALPDVSGALAEFLIERDLVAMATVMADLLAEPMPLESLELPFARGSRPAEVLGLRPRYRAYQAQATFSAAHLDRPLPQASPLTVAMCEQQCRDIVSRRQRRSGVAQRVRDQLVRLDGAPHTAGSVARSLAMSERTLRRRLADESAPFRQLSDEVNRALAEELLASGALSVDDVAIRLGYAEASSFIAAFKRWTGMTPARYGRSRRAAAL
jgi:AraC-like DNA-binding protein